jgi:hypothetical protein
MNLENDGFHITRIEGLARDLRQLLGGYGSGGRVTPNGRHPETGKTVRQTLEEMKADIDRFLRGAP